MMALTVPCIRSLTVKPVKDKRDGALYRHPFSSEGVHIVLLPVKYVVYRIMDSHARSFRIHIKKKIRDRFFHALRDILYIQSVGSFREDNKHIADLFLCNIECEA